MFDIQYSIILPTFNQKENLPTTIFLLQEMAMQEKIKLEIVVIEDNSPDGTLKIIQILKEHFKNISIKIIERPRKLGLGSAYRDGLKQCLGEFIIIMDADLSHHPKFIPQMIKKQKQTNADIVTGTRYVQNGGVEGWNFYRKLTSRTANFLTSFLLQTQCSDFTGSFRLYKKNILEQLMAMTKSVGYSFQMQIIVRAKWKNYKVQEIPIIFVDRLYGKSKLGPNQIFLYLKGLGMLFLQK